MSIEFATALILIQNLGLALVLIRHTHGQTKILLEAIEAAKKP